MDLRPRPNPSPRTDPPRTDPADSRAAGEGPRHGPHTLRVWKGAVVGLHGRDVFVELGPRMQGVIDLRAFEAPPAIGAVFEFTLRGQEEGLWALQLAEARPLVSWEQMEVGSVVQAHAVRPAPGGLEVKVGPLHGFLPKSHTGLARDEDPRLLSGKNLTVEVLEVDRQRQRVVVSRKLVLQRERSSEHQRHVGAVKPGDLVQGRVTRVEPYGVFVAFGHGLTGLVHVSNLAHERVEDARGVVQLGEILELRVLHVKQGGKRIGLGRKQLSASPWNYAEASLYEGQIVVARALRLVDQGAVLELRAGLEGFLPLSQCGLGPGQPLRALLAPGAELSARILELDAERERLVLSLLREDGRRILAEEARDLESFRARAADPQAGLRASLGLALRQALSEREKRAS